MSPNLLDSEDLELAVPGTYEPNHDIIHIKKVSPSLNVITSKQRPRKLVIQGQAYLLGAITSIGDNLAFVYTYVCTYVGIFLACWHSDLCCTYLLCTCWLCSSSSGPACQ